MLVRIPELPDDASMRSFALSTRHLRVDFREVGAVDEGDQVLALFWRNHKVGSDRLHLVQDTLKEALLNLGLGLLFDLWLHSVLL